MATSFFGGSFFGGEFFNTAAEAAIRNFDVYREPSEKDFLWSRKELEADEIVEKVALRQSVDLHLDEQQRFEELLRELELKGLEYESRYLDLLNKRREAIISLEIGRLIRAQIDERDTLILLLLAASV